MLAAADRSDDGVPGSDALQEWAFFDQETRAGGAVVTSVEYEVFQSDLLVIVSADTGSAGLQDGFLKLKIVLAKALVDPSGNRASQHHLERRIAFSLGLFTPLLIKYSADRSFSLTFEFGDGGSPHGLSMDRPTHTNWPLIPDIYLLLAARSMAQDPASFADITETTFRARTPILFWRGSTTGGLAHSLEELFQNQRVRNCRQIARVAGEHADCKISRIVQFLGPSEQEAIEALRAAGLFSPPVEESEFSRYQMYLDLPGNTAAWGTCYKYLSGCLVLRPPTTRELSYHSSMTPWESFIPVSEDMSDVGERIRWVIDHPRESVQIAKSGQIIMRMFVDRLHDYVSSVFDSQKSNHQT